MRRRKSRRTATTLGRAIGSIWTAMGLSMFIVLCAMGYSGSNFDGRAMIAVFAGMVGFANAACSMTLRWKAQFFCALLWWAAAAAACYCSMRQVLIIFLAAIFFGQIAFGGAMMISEYRQRKQAGRRMPAPGALHGEGEASGNQQR
jgi:hypothetical protein